LPHPAPHETCPPHIRTRGVPSPSSRRRNRAGRRNVPPPRGVANASPAQGRVKRHAGAQDGMWAAAEWAPRGHTACGCGHAACRAGGGSSPA
jgi:hypothetical protein